MSLLLAPFGRAWPSRRCLLLGAEQTSRLRVPTSEIDPNRTSGALDLCRKLLTLERNGLNEPTLTPSANVTAPASRAHVHRTSWL